MEAARGRAARAARAGHGASTGAGRGGLQAKGLQEGLRALQPGRDGRRVFAADGAGARRHESGDARAEQPVRVQIRLGRRGGRVQGRERLRALRPQVAEGLVPLRTSALRAEALRRGRGGVRGGRADRRRERRDAALARQVPQADGGAARRVDAATAPRDGLLQVRRRGGRGGRARRGGARAGRHRNPGLATAFEATFAHGLRDDVTASTRRSGRRTLAAVSTEDPRRGRGVAATRPHGMSTSPRRRDSPPRNSHVAALPRLASAEYPRRGVAATRLHGMSTSWPRRRRDSLPRNVYVAAIRLRGRSEQPRRRDRSVASRREHANAANLLEHSPRPRRRRTRTAGRTRPSSTPSRRCTI